MSLRRQGRLHQTVAAQQSEIYWDYQPDQRVMTVDGPGRVIAVFDGPFPGSEEYEIQLEGGLGGGTYSPSQIAAATPVQASVGTTDASVTHTADIDYPELGTILYDRPDPATIRHTAELGSGGGGGEGGSAPARSSAEVASGEADEAHGAWAPEYNNALYHDWRLASHRFIGAKAHDEYHDDTTYLRFGDWPHDERSYNNVTGGREEGVSVYDLDHHGQPMDPDPHYSRGHEHDEHCEPDCDLDQWNDQYSNDTHEEMNGRVYRAERGRREGYDRDSEVGHLVKGRMVGIGHDGEPLLNNVRRVGDWIDHKHLFFPKTKPHHLARDTDHEDYEPPEEPPTTAHTASSPDDEDFDEDNMCAVGHEGTCEEMHGQPSFHEGSLHTAMPSRRYPEHPEGFESHIEHVKEPWNRALVGYIHGNRVGSIHYTPYDEVGNPGAEGDDVRGIKVNYLHTGNADPENAMHYNPQGTGKGVASALMDHLYTKHPQALINHGYRTNEGLKWWNNYDEPNPAQNVHNLQPHEWKHLWDRKDVGSDILQNEENDPGHHSHEHDIDWAYEEEAPEPHPAEDTLHHGIAVHLSPSDHRMVHDQSIPTDERAHHLLNVIGRGNMPDFNWHPGPIGATHAANQAAHERPINTPDSFGSPGRTHVVVHALPMREEETEDHEYDPERHTIDFPSSPHGRKMELHGISWNTPGRGSSHHDFPRDEPEPVGIAPDSGAEHLPMHPDHARAVEDVRAHEERHRPREHGNMIPPGTGEQMKLFSQSSLSSLPGVEANTWIRPHDDDEDDLTDHLVNHHGQDRRFIGDAYDMHDRLHEEADDEDYMGPEPEGEPHEHHDMRDYHPQPWEGRDRSGGSSQEEEHRRFLAPGGGHDYAPVPRTIQSLNHLLVTAAMDTEFRFHITAAWRDVQAKAARIRKSGGVNITHASDGYVIANVQGDHHVYETGLQRVPGRRTAVAVYSCGCKWGAYHWGADDDMSRFAGRMCSHALALQYEAQARGMFGRDVTVDDTKPRWVPSKVVVKYDIDDGKSIKARSSLVVPEQAPLLACLALAEDDDPILGAVIAAVNDLFGDNSGTTEPMMISPAGPTVPWNTEENPTSAGTLAGGEPSNWGRINSPTMYPRLSSALAHEGFWHRVASILAGVETTLHEEPEPALPSTDGDDHTAVRHLATPNGEEPPQWIHDQRDQAHELATSRGHTLKWHYRGQPKYKIGDSYVAGYQGECTNSGCNPPKSVTRGAYTDDVKLIQIREDQPGDDVTAKMPAFLKRKCKGADPHTASLGDVDLTGGSGIGAMGDDELSPEDPSMQTMGAQEIVAAFQRSAGAKRLMDGAKPGDTSNSDIAGAAEAYLQKTAASSTEFSLAEREALINENPGVQASNTDRLDIAGTHYEDLEKHAMAEEDDDLWMA